MNNAVNRVRRRLLKSITALGTLVTVSPALGFSSSEPNLIAQKLTRVLNDKVSAKGIGSAYLSILPTEANIDLLVDRICLEQQSKKTQWSHCSRRALRKEIKQQIHDDFESDRVVSVEGWILSETEARLCALVALT